jgi:hypothetical protein
MYSAHSINSLENDLRGNPSWLEGLISTDMFTASDVDFLYPNILMGGGTDGWFR